MALNDNSKKVGKIFMGDREATPEELQSMQEPLRRKQIQKEQGENYMERVRARAADRAREILGAAYAEKQSVLEEGKKEILALKHQAAEECARLKNEGEIARRTARQELDKANAIREEAEKIRAAAREEGLKAGMDEAQAEIQDLKGEMGQSVAVILSAMERQRKAIVKEWINDLVEIVRRCAMAGTGLVLREAHDDVLKNLLFKALDMLEQHSTVTVRVNPEDEDLMDQMFHAAKERYPNLSNWIVKGDSNIEKGGLVAESGSGTVDLKRENFDNMLKNVLCHLYLPEDETANAREIRELVEQEVARIASLTPEIEPEPEPELPPPPEPIQEAAEYQEASTIPAHEPPLEASSEDEIDEILNDEDILPDMGDDGQEMPDEQAGLEMEEIEEPEAEVDLIQEAAPQEAPEPEPVQNQPSLEELEDELFPLDDEAPKPPQAPPRQPKQPEPPQKNVEPDPDALAEGGFV